MSATNIQIHDGPMPGLRRSGRGSKYPLASMEIGQWITVDTKPATMRSVIQGFLKRTEGEPMKFSIHKNAEGGSLVERTA